MKPNGSAVNLSIPVAATHKMTPDLVMDLLGRESVLNAIKSDLSKTRQIGGKEVWRLGLVTPDQDRYDPRPGHLSRSEALKKGIADSDYRLNRLGQIPVKRTAVLHSTNYFNTQFNNLMITGGTVPRLIRTYPGWSYHLETRLNEGEYIDIRQIQVDTHSLSSRDRSPFLTRFLQEDGFPIRDAYADGDPLTTDRGGTLVNDNGKIIIIYPRYFVQRRLIDDEGNLVDIGMDESFNHSTVFDVCLKPSVSRLLFEHIAARGYIPILRYGSFPYASDLMLPLIDTPMSASGWADLYIDTRGKAKLFIARDKTLEEWVEMMNRLKQLFLTQLAQTDYHLLGLTKDKACLNDYLRKKLEILEDYFLIRDWQLF